MSVTSIEWTRGDDGTPGMTWSPIRARVRHDAGRIAQEKGYTSLVEIGKAMAGHVGPHCERISHGCDHCYSDTNNARCLPGNGTGLPFDRRARDLITPFVDEKIILQPLHWRKPRRVFVENQSDLFGEWVPDEMLDRIFAVMALCPQHQFQVLTKRHERMLDYFMDEDTPARIDAFAWEMIEDRIDPTHRRSDDIRSTAQSFEDGPLVNVWLGVSAEDQKTWDERTAILEQVPAAVRFVSLEPQLEYVGVGDVLHRHKIHWLIQGGESGPGARPFHIDWARSAAAQSRSAKVAYFLKQLGAHPYDESTNAKVPLKDRKGGKMEEWPEEVPRAREFPTCGS